MNLGALILVLLNFLALFSFITMKSNEVRALLNFDLLVMKETQTSLENRQIKNLGLEHLELGANDD